MVLVVAGVLLIALLAPILWSVSSQDGSQPTEAANGALGCPEMLERTSISRELRDILGREPRTREWTHTYQTATGSIQYCVVIVSISSNEFIRFALYRRSAGTAIDSHVCETSLSNEECLAEGLAGLFPEEPDISPAGV